MYEENPFEEVREALESAQAVFTNPNKASFTFTEEVLRQCKELRVICTASTGTNHIDVGAATLRGIRVLSLRTEKETINKIGSTAELALTLMLASLRRLLPASLSVRGGNWDYLPFVGRQVSDLRVGSVGFGRLGQKFLSYVEAMGAEVFFVDPFVSIESESVQKLSTVEELFSRCDVVSLHIHADEANLGLISERSLNHVHGEFHLINTSRGGVVDEEAVLLRASEDSNFFYASDVLDAEISGRWPSPLVDLAKSNSNVLLTPHVGGMTVEGQEMAFHRAADLLQLNLQERGQR